MLFAAQVLTKQLCRLSSGLVAAQKIIIIMAGERQDHKGDSYISEYLCVKSVMSVDIDSFGSLGGWETRTWSLSIQSQQGKNRLRRYIKEEI